jgi:hypothetical protein
VYTIAPGLVAGRTVASTSSAEVLRWPTPNQTRPLEDPAATLAAVIGDRRVGTTAVDVETLGGGTAGTGEPVGVEQIEELLATPLLVHEVEDREVHEAGSGEMSTNKPQGQETRSAGG